MPVAVGHAAIAFLAALAWPVQAQTYPSKPVRVIVAFGPGGISDTIARTVGQKLSERFAQPFVVENRGGAGGIVAAKLAVAAPPDGHTLLVHTVASVITAATSKEAPEPSSELTPIAITASAPTIFAVHGATTAKTLNEFVRTVKAGRFSYASAGIGSAEHLTTQYVFAVLAGLEATHVPYQGGVAPINAVLGQQVDMASTTIPTAFAHVKQGTLKVLAVANRHRLTLAPDAPTLAEAGFADFENASWVAVFAPAKTPSAIIDTLNAAINGALGDAEVKARLTTIGLEPQSRSAAEFADYLKSEATKWARVVKATGVTPN